MIPRRSASSPAGGAPAAAIRPAEVALLASVFIVAACGLVYELAAGTLASYLLGDSILQFSTVIGTYLFAMGLGSWLSRYLERQLVAQFLRIELLVGLVGGLMPAALFALQSATTPSFRFALYAFVLAVGILVGLEIPLVMRILQAPRRRAPAASARPEDARLAGAHVRLPRRARGGDRLSARCSCRSSA